jgi:hypothetical protein
MHPFIALHQCHLISLCRQQSPSVQNLLHNLD